MGDLFVRFVLPGLFFLSAFYAAIDAKREYAVERFVRAGEKITSSHEAIDFLRTSQHRSADTAEALRVEMQLMLLAAQDDSLSATDKSRYLCGARDSAFKMHHLRPMDSEALARLAYLDLILEHSECSAGMKIDAASLMSRALSTGRRNSRVLIFAARFAHLKGDFQSTIHFLHDYNALRGTPTALDKQFISQVLESGDVSVSEFFPEDPFVYASWMKILANENPGLLSLLADQMNAQLSSLLDKFSVTDRRADVPLLLEIFFLPQTTSSRQAIARYFGRLSLSGSKDHEMIFFTSLTEHNPKQILPGYIRVDSSPMKSPLRNWGASRIFALDARKRSAGFYLASEQPLEIIDIISRAPAVRKSIPSLLKLFVSDNNYEWREVTDKVRVERFVGQGFQALRLSFPETSGRYWKIYNAGLEDDEAFYSPLNMFIQAYGA